jgi:hypothetical protein
MDESMCDAELSHLKLEILRFEDFAQNDTPLYWTVPKPPLHRQPASLHADTHESQPLLIE